MTIREVPPDRLACGDRCTVVDVPGPWSRPRRACVVGPLDDHSALGHAYSVHEWVNRALDADGFAPVAQTHVVSSSSTGAAWERLHHDAVEAVAAGAGPAATAAGFSAFAAS